MLLSPTNAAAFRRDACSRRSACGFTLIELLTVIAIIGILAAITLNVATGVKTRAAISQAKAELSVLSNALEGYKRQYGDYPQTDKAAALLNALIGKRGPQSSASLNGITGKNFLELSKFTLADSADSTAVRPDPFTLTTVTLVDPWGTSYFYDYKPHGEPTWTHSYVLYSKGPPSSTNNQNPPSGADVIVDNTGLVNNTTDSSGQILPQFAGYIFANQ